VESRDEKANQIHWVAVTGFEPLDGRYMADKLAVLSLFRSHPDTWVSAADIVSAVGDVPDRTLRNWLRELVEDGSIEPKGQRSPWRSCQRFDTNVQVVGFDEVAALYRTQRRALVTKLVRAKVPPDEVAEWIMANVPNDIEPQHHEKFVSDVIAEVDN
jgi:hypothetical protein